MKKYFHLVPSITSIVIGCIALIWGFNLTMYGTTESSKSYGGDAYTGIQNAAAQTATNTYYIGEAVVDGFQAVLTVAGLTFISRGVITLVGIKLDKKEAEEAEK